MLAFRPSAVPLRLRSGRPGSPILTDPVDDEADFFVAQLLRLRFSWRVEGGHPVIVFAIDVRRIGNHLDHPVP